jgi:membrane protease YdiL (CAAX protease family)
MAELEPNADRRHWLAMVFALLFPTLLTVVYFVLLAKHSPAMQQAAYAIGKTIQFAFPAFWVLWIQRQRIRLQAPLAKDLLFGAVLGAVLLAVGLALYELCLKPAGVFDAPAIEVRNKVAGIGIHGFWPYVIMSLFYCVLHSLLEEYYWRWFVFAQLRPRMSLAAAIGISSLGFMAHHVCVLSIYFGWFTLWSTLFSAAVAGGGVIWAWQYHKTGSLYGVWICHALVDAVIFIIGYDLIT